LSSPRSARPRNPDASPLDEAFKGDTRVSGAWQWPFAAAFTARRVFIDWLVQAFPAGRGCRAPPLWFGG